MVSPAYMYRNREYPTYLESTNDTGGTFNQRIGPIGGRVSAEQGYLNYPFNTGGTILNPRVLPPVRTYHLQ